MLPFTEFRADTACSRDPVRHGQEDRAVRSFENVRQSGIRAITVENGDRLIKAELTTKAARRAPDLRQGFAVRVHRGSRAGRWAGRAGVRGILAAAPTTAWSGCPTSCATTPPPH